MQRRVCGAGASTVKVWQGMEGVQGQSRGQERVEERGIKEVCARCRREDKVCVGCRLQEVMQGIVRFQGELHSRGRSRCRGQGS